MKRDSNEISNIQDAWNELVTNATVAGEHGCHCFALGDNENYQGGQPEGGIDELDLLCKRWKLARQCVELENGACYQTPELSSYDRATNCTEFTEECQKQLCLIDQSFSNDINDLFVDDPPTIDDNPTCIPSGTTNNHNACCGSSVETYVRFTSTENSCNNGQLGEIVQDCPEGQQRDSLDNECKPCPANTFSSGTACMPCNNVADILIVLDGSGSMTSMDGSATKWEQQRTAVQSFVSKFEVGTNQIRFRIVQYNKEVFGSVGWGVGNNITTLNTALDTLVQADEEFCGSCSQVYQAYDGESDFSYNFGLRPRENVPKFALIFADGMNSDQDENFVKTALNNGLTWATDNDLEIFFVRVGSGETVSGSLNVSKNHLVNNENNFMTTGSNGWAGLNDFIPVITNKICTAS